MAKVTGIEVDGVMYDYLENVENKPDCGVCDLNKKCCELSELWQYDYLCSDGKIYKLRPK